MARPREFDRKEVLKKATFTFWDKGYEATSMEELVTVTGLNRGSMYNLFGNKEGLFLATIDNYFDFIHETFGAPLRKAEGLKSIREYFSLVGGKLCKYGRGCFFTNSAIETKSVPEAVNERVHIYFRTQHDLFAKCLEVAKKKGEIPADRDIQKLSSYLVCLTQGLTVMSKLNKQTKTIQDVIDVALEQL